MMIAMSDYDGVVYFDNGDEYFDDDYCDGNEYIEDDSNDDYDGDEYFDNSDEYFEDDSDDYDDSDYDGE